MVVYCQAVLLLVSVLLPLLLAPLLIITLITSLLLLLLLPGFLLPGILLLEFLLLLSPHCFLCRAFRRDDLHTYNVDHVHRKISGAAFLGLG
jgi:hypothetical protein